MAHNCQERKQLGFRLGNGLAYGSIGSVLMRLQRRKRSGWLCLLACALHLLAPFAHASFGLNRRMAVYAPPVWDAEAEEFVRPVTETTYDDLGQVLTVTDPLGNVTTKFYDEAGRNWKVEAPVLENEPTSQPIARDMPAYLEK